MQLVQINITHPKYLIIERTLEELSQPYVSSGKASSHLLNIEVFFHFQNNLGPLPFVKNMRSSCIYEKLRLSSIYDKFRSSSNGQKFEFVFHLIRPRIIYQQICMTLGPLLGLRVGNTLSQISQKDILALIPLNLVYIWLVIPEHAIDIKLACSGLKLAGIRMFSKIYINMKIRHSKHSLWLFS